MSALVVLLSLAFEVFAPKEQRNKDASSCNPIAIHFSSQEETDFFFHHCF